MIRLRFSDDRGFAMIEAIAAAALLAVVALGVLRGLDVAQRSSGREKARSAAAALTEQDQERLRSFRAVDLANYDETRNVTVNGVKYTVTSLAEWVRDSTGGTESCNSNTVQADYMRITSTTKSGLINTPIPPIKMSSIVAPPVGEFGDNQGTLGVQVNDRNGNGVPGMPVTITGPATVQNPTNSAGCAIFAYVPIGTYTASVDTAGWVDKGGNQKSTVGATVSQGQVKVANLTYDRAASVSVKFDTETLGGSIVSANPPFTVKTTQLGAANTGVPAGPLSIAGIRKFGTAGTFVDTITAGGLFPFTDGYGLFGGVCGGADPTKYDPDYYTAFPAAQVASEPGQVSPDATVRLPSINLKVQRDGLVPNTAVKLLITSTASGCTEAFSFTDAVNTATGVMKPELQPLPFGDYQICASMLKTGSTTTYVKKTVSGIQNRWPAGIKPTAANPTLLNPTINVTSLDLTGQCF
jgi:Tfp pilus assembly protein PilV